MSDAELSSLPSTPAEFLGLEPTDDPLHWRLPLIMRVCGASGFLHGGCALGAAVTVLEAAAGRRLGWIAAQYVSRVKPDQVVDLRVELRAEGKAMTQAALTATCDDRLVFSALASLGGRDVGLEQAWFEMPEVPQPDDCPGRMNETREAGSFTTVADVRVARAELGSRNTTYWARLPGTLATTATGVAMLADLLPSAMRIAMGREMQGSSLDNTIRMATTGNTEWLLIDTEITALGTGIGHGVVRTFSSDGVLLGSAGQSFGMHSLQGPLPSSLR